MIGFVRRHAAFLIAVALTFRISAEHLHGAARSSQVRSARAGAARRHAGAARNDCSALPRPFSPQSRRRA